jgi:hypothetical protein
MVRPVSRFTPDGLLLFCEGQQIQGLNMKPLPTAALSKALVFHVLHLQLVGLIVARGTISRYKKSTLVSLCIVILIA